MMLVVHIMSAMAGITGACLSGGIILHQSNRKGAAQLHKVYYFGRWLVLAGLLGSVISGISLLAADLQEFLQSSKFLSNMTVLGILVAVEVSLLYIRKEDLIERMHVVSMLSWVWIFVIALLDLPYPYWTLVMVYLLLAVGLVVAARQNRVE